jgi:hypothetical protein
MIVHFYLLKVLDLNVGVVTKVKMILEAEEKYRTIPEGSPTKTAEYTAI